ncbi:MAG: formate dehydrogenase accessory sulfurtransferase FdhD [Candidatus Bathyarchaeota archaeon]|nr:formate dehydrogenase accessory sulfurtransferase FdhD [Candidatus Bathyarchaeota archaeon]
MRVLRFDSGAAEYLEDEVVEDVLVRIRVNGVPLSELMAYEKHLDELVLGHLRTINIIDGTRDVESINWTGNTVNVQLNCSFDPEIHRELWLSILEHAYKDEEIDLESNDGLDLILPEDVFKAMGLLNDSCDVFKQTGGTHSALIYHRDLGYVFAEDVGRFNALDKVVGLAMDAGINLGESILVTSGRLSGEMVLKAAFAGVPVMCSVSAPMCSGVCIAQAAGMSLLGFVRGERFNVYSGFRRISS